MRVAQRTLFFSHYGRYLRVWAGRVPRNSKSGLQVLGMDGSGKGEVLCFILHIGGCEGGIVQSALDLPHFTLNLL